jgi:Pyruvate/2-oxoacid:ferredoxin oxidoreductase gamma subunit
VEREVLLTGIGGQGMQLAAQTLAIAAIREGREVMLFGTYGGSMRGGNSDSTVVIGDHPILTPPTVTVAAFAIGMHHEYWPGVASRLAPGAIAVTNSSVFQAEAMTEGRRLFEIPASTMATDMGAPQAATMIALGALAALTQLVGIESLVAAAPEALPPYRRSHAAQIVAALQAGAALMPEPAGDAWEASREKVAT